MSDDAEKLAEQERILESLDGLEAELYRDFKFRVLMFEELLNTDEIIHNGFCLKRDFIEKVVIDELIFSQMPMREKKKKKMRSHKDLGVIFSDDEEGRAKKEKQKEEIFDNFIEKNCLGSKKSKDDLHMFKDTFELTKKAWKKDTGFSNDNFYRFAKNRASDPELVDIYKDWFETIFSAAAMLAWQAIRLRENPEVIEEKVPAKEKEAGKEIGKEEGEEEKKKKPIVLSPKIKLALMGIAATFFISTVFYFTIKALFKEEMKVKKEEPEKKQPKLEKVSLTHLCGKKWVHNKQNDITLLGIRDKKSEEPIKQEESEKKIYYPMVQAPYEAYFSFRNRVDNHRKVLEKCGYKVVDVKGVEAALLEKEKKYLEFIEKCKKEASPKKMTPQPAANEIQAANPDNAKAPAPPPAKATIGTN